MPQPPNQENDDMTKRELLWKKYELDSKRYQFHLELIVKIEIAYFGITGAIIAFTLSRDTTFVYAPWAIAVSVIVGVALALIYFFAAKSWVGKFEEAHNELTAGIDDPLIHTTEFDPLRHTLWCVFVFKIVTVIGCILLMGILLYGNGLEGIDEPIKVQIVDMPEAGETP